MPIYEYACASCGARFEHLQAGTAIINLTCPVCSSNNTSKLISIPAVVRGNNKTQ